MKILISNPPWYMPIGAVKAIVTSSGLRAGGRWPYTSPGIPTGYFPFPFNMAYADAYLKQMGVDSTMRDSIMLRDEYSYFFGVARGYDYVVLETAIASKENDWYVITEVAKHSKVILVGPYATSEAYTMTTYPEVYAVLRGEYEKSLYACLTGGKGGVYEFDEWENIDDAPFPTRDTTLYRYTTPRHPLAINMWGSRGCPFSCSFCYSQNFQKSHRYRGHSPARLKAELADVLTRLPKIQYIYFDDDTFNIGDERIKGIARVLKGFGLPWGAMCRADTCTLDTFQVMADSGCVEVKIGIESGSQRVLDEIIGKKLDLEKAIRTVKAVQKMGIKVHGTFMRGFKGETIEEIRKTKALINTLGCNSHQFSKVIPA